MVGKILLILLFPFAYIFATELPISEAHPTIGSIIRVVINQADSITGLDNDRLYLKSENIFHSQYGYVLHNGKSTVVLPRLSFDENSEGYLLCCSTDDFQLTCSNSD